MYKVIIVDDEEMIRNGIKNVIAWQKLSINEVVTSSSAKEAFNIMKERNFDIMITDICMPEMDGLSLVEEMNNLNPSLKIIVLTGFDNFKYAQKCCKMKVNDFLLKPVDEEELSKIIGSLVKDLDTEKDKIEKERKIVRFEGTEEEIKLERLMQNLIYNKSNSDDSYEILNDYKLKEDYKYRVAIFAPILDENLSWKNHLKLLNLSVKKACIEVFDCNNKGITFEDKNKNIIIVMFINNIKINGEIEFLAKYLKDEYEIKPKYVLGSIVNSIEKINISYNDGIMLINNKRSNIKKYKSIDYENQLRDFNENLYYVKNSIVNNMNSLEELLIAYDKFTELIDSYSLSIDFTRKICFDIATTIYFSNINEFDNNENKINLLALSLQSLDKENALKITREFIEKMYGFEEIDSKEVIKNAKKFIKNNLDKSLSVCNIAEMLYINPTYFSRLFKNNTGEGCNNYIVKKKMEKAKYLLQTTTMRISKIAELVGYKDTNYFSLTFKKQIGVTPRDFRETTEKI